MKMTYEAMDRSGKPVRDTLTTATVEEGMEELRRQGLFVTKVEESETPAEQTVSSRMDAEALNKTRLPLSQLILFTRQMSMLLRSGSAVVPALNAIAQQMKQRHHAQMVEAIRDELEEGRSLTDSLGRFPLSFDPSYRAVVAAGESANLPLMFERLAMITGKRRSMRNKIVGAMIYPLLLSVMSINILSAMIFFVVPRFASMFDSLGVELPFSTLVMVTVADQVKAFWWLCVLVVAAFVAGIYALFRTDGGKQVLADVQLRIPLLGLLASRLIQAQVFRILGMLLESRVGLLEALSLGRRVTRNRRFGQMFDALDESISQGESLTQTMESAGLINPAIVQAIRTGENSGRLGESISYVADVLDEENGELLATLTRLVEPVVLIVMGAVVGTIAVSLFMPLFDMTSAI